MNCNIRGIPMKNSNQYDFAMASLNCLTFAASSSIIQTVDLSTFSAKSNGHISVGFKPYLANESSMKEKHILLNFISIWLSMSSFPPRTSPRPPHL